MSPHKAIVIFLALLLVGCSPAATSAPVNSPLPSTATPLPPAQTSTPSPTAYPFEPVTFQTEDGVELAGTLYGSGGIAVLLAHQGTPGADQTTWQQFAITLAENGYTALTFDFRGVGCSGGVLDYGLLDKDVRAAVQYLQDRQFLQIICAGASMGGTACLRVAIDDQPFIGLIILASTFTAGHNDLKVLPEELALLTLPKLFITAEGILPPSSGTSTAWSSSLPNPGSFSSSPGTSTGRPSSRRPPEKN